MKALKRFLKIIASGIGFTALGVGGLFFALVGVPFLRLLPGGKEALRRRTRRVAYRFFQGEVRFLTWAGIFTVRTLELPPRAELDGTLILATHPGYLDVVILLGTLDQLTCIVKPGVWHNPLFGGVVRAAGYISADSPEAVIERGAEALARGETLVLFPEGTRTSPGSPYRFQRGAAHLILKSRAPILPVHVSCEPPLLAKGDRWYHMPVDPCDYRIRALAPLDPPLPPPADHPEPLAARDLTGWLEARFNEEVYG